MRGGREKERGRKMSLAIEARWDVRKGERRGQLDQRGRVRAAGERGSTQAAVGGGACQGVMRDWWIGMSGMSHEVTVNWWGLRGYS